MSNDADLHSLDVLIKHDETLFGSTRYNTIGLVEQIQNINNQINNINNAPAPDVYTRPEANEIFDTKADKTDTYTKSEDNALLLLKANVAEFVDSYSKTEDDALLLLKANVSDIVDSYSKTEDDALLLLKADKTQLIDSYTKSEDDALLLLKANVADIVDSYSKTEDDALLALKANVADIVDSYSKTETDTKLDLKADKTQLIDSYTKSEDDALLLLKANVADIVDSYSKTETDTKLDLKANVADIVDSYSKTEDDALLLLKANVADLTNYVDLQSAQTILGTKQFGVISATTISKLTKNDASILLAGGGDMLVSSLVTQPQLQEIRDIATGKSKAYVFSTQEELNDWMAVPDNVANLVIGDNLYIVDQEVTDYWWDGTQLRELETQLPDLTNVVTTLGTATGSGNAITDISIDGNTLTPAKNKNFVDLEYNQTITGQKSFTTTIHSVGITYQDYDNSNVILAGGGVRAIADIQSASYTKAQDDALLLLKADKTQLIDSYTKTETNNLLNNKTNTGVSYTKSEDDALLLLKADKTQLIDSYTKTETDTKLGLKADQSTTYTKAQDDALLLLKADKSQLIDSYTKSQDDALLLLKADKTQLIDSYTKTETNNLLNNKANQSTTYTKTETDNLIAQIDVGDVDLSSYYTKTKTDELLGEKAYTTDLENYMTLGTQQVITANKTFQNPCRFTSSIDGMGTVTGSSFVKSGADDSVVLLGAGGTKPISEFGGSVDDSNYVKKTGQETQSIEGYLIRSGSEISFVNLEPSQYITKSDGKQGFVQKQGQTVQRIHGVLRKDVDEESISEYDEDYLTRAEVDTRLINYVNKTTTQTIAGSKTFSSNVTASGFAKTGKDDTSVLLAGVGDALISSFGGIEDLTSTVSGYGANMVFTNTTFIKIGKLRLFRGTVHPYNNISASTSDSVVSLSFLNHPASDTPLIVARDTTNSIKMYVSASNSTVYVNTTTSSWANTLEITIYGWWIAPQVYLDEALLDQAGLHDFPELYAYIRERYQQPDPPAVRIPIGDQTLQAQVKRNDDIFYGSGDFVAPPVPNAPTKIDYGSQLEIYDPFYMSFNNMAPANQLVVVGNKICINLEVKMNNQYKGYVLKSFPEDAKPKNRQKICVPLGSNCRMKQNVYCYIDENGPYIAAEDDTPVYNGALIIIACVYYTDYELVNQVNHDANNDGKIDINDTHHQNSLSEKEAQSYVYDVVKQQTAIADSQEVVAMTRYNYLNNNTKLINPQGIYNIDRTAYIIVDEPTVTFSFKSTVQNYMMNIYNVFSTVDKEIIPELTKVFPVTPMQAEYVGKLSIGMIASRNTAFQVDFSGTPTNLEVEFNGTWKRPIQADTSMQQAVILPDAVMPLTSKSFNATIMQTVTTQSKVKAIIIQLMDATI
ncbi:MAG: hypothetical protein EZS28_013328 [Streblomastix strix]|uniref:Uncharacterized protein n=1 Tax=Streblomastix strix TaxID=222440 RepID=A0A5J4W8X1_9EUKA|nr:MAG: hypothetical protein EZS28_013328 [Streblomastix strix]